MAALPWSCVLLFSWMFGLLTPHFYVSLAKEQWDGAAFAHFPAFLLSQPSSWWRRRDGEKMTSRLEEDRADFSHLL